jgi:hypothetical protein
MLSCAVGNVFRLDRLIAAAGDGMGLRDFFRRSGSAQATPERAEDRRDRVIAKMSELYDQLPDNYWPEFDLVPFAHRPVFDYFKLCWAGVAADPEFEKKSLKRDFHMKAFNLAALLYLVAVERDIPLERVHNFLSPSVPGADYSIPTCSGK